MNNIYYLHDYCCISSQKVLKKAGVFHKYNEFSREGSDFMRLYKPNKDKPEFIITIPKFLQWFLPPTPESNRQQLREALIESASKGKNVDVKFNYSITKIKKRNEK